MKRISLLWGKATSQQKEAVGEELLKTRVAPRNELQFPTFSPDEIYNEAIQ